MINIFAWIDNNIELKLSVDDVVNISGYSRRHLHNIFISHTSRSVAEYIRLKKLICASMLLKLTNLTVIDISVRFHFDSPQTFSQVFKKYYAMSPLQYRRSFQWGKNIYFSDPSKKDNAVYNIIRTDRILINGSRYVFDMDVSERNDFWYAAQKKIDKLRLDSLDYKRVNKIISAVIYYPSFKNRNHMTVEYIYDDDHFIHSDKHQVILPSGDFLKATKLGNLSDFHAVPNALYRDVLYAFNLRRRNECDFETITRLDSGELEFSYFIPVEL
ncbi:helix-turn-helix transcriptional regulator [Citrobacter freundii]